MSGTFLEADFQPSLKGVLKIYFKFTEEHPCRSVLIRTFIVIALWHGCSPVNLLHIIRTLFYKNTNEGLIRIALHHFMHNAEKWPNILKKSCGLKVYMKE